MYSTFQSIHSFLAYILISILVMTIILLLINKARKRPFAPTSKWYALMGLMIVHIQFLVGLFLYFISPLGLNNLSGETMKDSFGRMMALEHPIIMILSVIIVTVGYSKAKKAFTDHKSYNAILIFYTIGLVLILSRIPWQTWL